MRGDIPLLLLQINDAAFPIGGYTQSYGLETYIQQGAIRDIAAARVYLYQKLRCNLKYTELLGLGIAFDCARQHDLVRLMRLEQTITASKAPQEIRLASHKMGSRFVKNLYSMGVVKANSIFDQYCKRYDSVRVNHCVAYGVFCSSCGINKEMAMTAYLYSAFAAAVTVCVKLVPLSQTNGQRLIYEAHPLLEQTVSETLLLSEKDLCLSTPGFDIHCMQHEELYSRLFMS